MRTTTPTIMMMTLCTAMAASIGACTDEDEARAPDEPERTVLDPKGESLIEAGVDHMAAADANLFESGIPQLFGDEEVRQQLVQDSRDSLVQLNEFLLVDEEIPEGWIAYNEGLGALLDRVAGYDREAGETGIAGVVEAARVLLAHYDDGDARARLVHGPQRRLVTGILMAAMGERVVLREDESVARDEQAALCALATARAGAIAGFEAELDAWVDADFEGTTVEVRCKKQQGGGECPTTKTGNKVKVLHEACFIAPDGEEECTESTRLETWKWKKGQWKIDHKHSNHWPTDAQLMEQGQSLLQASTQRRKDDAHGLVFGDELLHGEYVAELDRIAACEDVPSYQPPADPEPDPTFCADFDDSNVLLELGDGTTRVQARLGQTLVYQDDEVSDGEFERFRVRCRDDGAFLLTQSSIGGTLSVGAAELPGYGSVQLVPAIGAAARDDVWLLPIAQGDGQWGLRTPEGTYLLGDDGDPRLGQADRNTLTGTLFTVRHPD